MEQFSETTASCFIMKVVQKVHGSVELVIALCQLSKNARHQLYVESIEKMMETS